VKNESLANPSGRSLGSIIVEERHYALPLAVCNFKSAAGLSALGSAFCAQAATRSIGQLLFSPASFVEHYIDF
jgi:hypothetical protein